MSPISQFFFHIYTITIIYFTVVILEIVILLRSISGKFSGATTDRPITTPQYLRLIENKYPSIRFSSGCSRHDSKGCAVCLSNFQDGEEIRWLNCHHVFHKNCLDTWLQQDWATCPLCRSELLPEEIVRRRRNEEQEQLDGSDDELVLLLSSLHGSYFRRFL